nr:hypothetical protein [Tateyamaria sp. Alg231-49]
MGTVTKDKVLSAANHDAGGVGCKNFVWFRGGSNARGLVDHGAKEIIARFDHIICMQSDANAQTWFFPLKEFPVV